MASTVTKHRVHEGESMSTPSRRLLVSLSPCLLVSLSLLAAGCDPPGRPDPKDRPVPEELVTDFGKLYGRNCAGCHGAEGELGPGPPLRDPLFRSIVPEKELESVITQGRVGTPMAAFAKEYGGTLTAAQIQVLVNEIKGIPYRTSKEGEGEETRIKVVRDATGIAPTWGPPRKAIDHVPPYLASESKVGGAGAGGIEEGSKVFARACASCHGTDGKGIAQAGRPLLKIKDVAFLTLLSDKALRRFAITGRSDLGMPSYEEKAGRSQDFQALTSEEIAAVVELLAYWRQGGSGNGK
jgi:cytochrome c oxidase cbb3-type subunit 3